MKKFVLILMCVLFFANSQCQAAEDWAWRVTKTTVDLFIARPFTLAATAVGAVLWGVTLPVTYPTKTSTDAFDVMVETPWAYTVDRPLGDFED
jgi:hypothetical protein